MGLALFFGPSATSFAGFKPHELSNKGHSACDALAPSKVYHNPAEDAMDIASDLLELELAARGALMYAPPGVPSAAESECTATPLDEIARLVSGRGDMMRRAQQAQVDPALLSKVGARIDDLKALYEQLDVHQMLDEADSPSLSQTGEQPISPSGSIIGTTDLGSFLDTPDLLGGYEPLDIDKFLVRTDAFPGQAITGLLVHALNQHRPIATIYTYAFEDTRILRMIESDEQLLKCLVAGDVRVCKRSEGFEKRFFEQGDHRKALAVRRGSAEFVAMAQDDDVSVAQMKAHLESLSPKNRDLFLGPLELIVVGSCNYKSPISWESNMENSVVFSRQRTLDEDDTVRAQAVLADLLERVQHPPRWAPTRMLGAAAELLGIDTVGGQPDITEVDHPEKPGEVLQLIARPANGKGTNDYKAVSYQAHVGRFRARLSSIPTGNLERLKDERFETAVEAATAYALAASKHAAKRHQLKDQVYAARASHRPGDADRDADRQRDLLSTTDGFVGADPRDAKRQRVPKKTQDLGPELRFQGKR